jgi:hypothetical protein
MTAKRAKTSWTRRMASPRLFKVRPRLYQEDVQAGTPSFVAGGRDVDPMKTAQVRVVDTWPTVAVHPSPVRVIVGPVTPVDGLHSDAGMLVA